MASSSFVHDPAPSNANGSTAGSLPCHGRIDCTLCHGSAPVFNKTQTTSVDDAWRITANPMAWGNPRPEVLVLGFSKGPNQIADIEARPHDEVAFRGGRANVGKILAHVGLIPPGDNEDLRAAVDDAISDTSGRFGWGSLIRCTVERHNPETEKWVATSQMIDPFMKSQFGSQVTAQCSSHFLGNLPVETRLIVMFGLGTKLGYVASARKAVEAARQGPWKDINDIAYGDGRITVVHVEHFKAQGPLISQWLGKDNHSRADLGDQAKAAVRLALS